jgi:hypothetical protein
MKIAEKQACFYAKGQHPENLFKSLKHLLSEAAVRSSRHQRETQSGMDPA